MVHVRWALVLAGVAAMGAGAARADDAELTSLLNTGKYEEAATAADAALTLNAFDDRAAVIRVKALLAVGQYEQALAAGRRAIEDNPESLQLRLVLAEALKANGKAGEALGSLQSIATLAQEQPLSYQDAANQATIGQALVAVGGADARKVLEQYYDKAKKAFPKAVEPLQATGELGLDKHDHALAADAFRAAAKLNAEDPEIWLGLARATADAEGDEAETALKKALALNPRMVGALLFEADHLIDGEAYDEAGAVLQRALAVNPKSPEAWAYEAVLAHLKGDHAGEVKAEAKGLEPAATNPVVDYTIGWKLAANYRFAEAAAYQRKALDMDATYLPSKGELATDLLRLGEEDEGWKLVDEVNKADPYDVTAYNLVTLHGVMNGYRTLKSDHFEIKMDPREADIYGGELVKMLETERAELTKRYDIDWTGVTHIEVFTRQRDFQIRTFGLPIGEGFLGVCFGPVLTMNSPAALASHPENWQAILWHEFGHTVTLTKTHNKMPRWLSEGISVYEERRRNGTWGQAMTPSYRQVILGEAPKKEGSYDVTPVSKLSSAFLKPPSGEALMFAYFESSQVVKFIEEKWGQAALNAVLKDLGEDVNINVALAKHTEPMDKLDADFAAYLKTQAQALGKDADWSTPDLAANADAAALAAYVKAHPTNLQALVGQGALLMEAGQWAAAREPLLKAVALYPEDADPNGPWAMLAAADRQLGDEKAERDALEKLAALSPEALDERMRLMQMGAADKDWTMVRDQARDYLAVNPLVAEPWRKLAAAADALGDNDSAIDARRALVKLDAVDVAGQHYELGRLLFEQGRAREARREIDMALEEAPRYRAAAALLLKIADRMNHSWW